MKWKKNDKKRWNFDFVWNEMIEENSIHRRVYDNIDQT